MNPVGEVGWWAVPVCSGWFEEFCIHVKEWLSHDRNKSQDTQLREKRLSDFVSGLGPICNHHLEHGGVVFLHVEYWYPLAEIFGATVDQHQQIMTDLDQIKVIRTTMFRNTRDPVEGKFSDSGIIESFLKYAGVKVDNQALFWDEILEDLIQSIHSGKSKSISTSVFDDLIQLPAEFEHTGPMRFEELDLAHVGRPDWLRDEFFCSVLWGESPEWRDIWWWMHSNNGLPDTFFSHNEEHDIIDSGHIFHSNQRLAQDLKNFREYLHELKEANPDDEYLSDLELHVSNPESGCADVVLTSGDHREEWAVGYDCESGGKVGCLLCPSNDLYDPYEVTFKHQYHQLF